VNTNPPAPLPPLLAAASALELDRDAASSGESADYQRGMTRAVQLLRLLNEEEATAPSSLPDQTLRDRVAEALAEADGWKWAPGFKSESPTWQEYLGRAGAVLAVLPPDGHTTNRAAVLLGAAGHLDARAAEFTNAARKDPLAFVKGGTDARYRTADCWNAAAEELRRLAAEAQPEASPLGGRKTGTAFSPSEGVHGQDPYYDGTDTPQPDTETMCGPAPSQCDAESGEPCANHEREQAHAEGEHCFCGPECPGACTCVSAGDGFVPLGHYRDCPAAAPEPHPTEADVRHALAVLDQFEGRDAAASAAAGPGRAADTHNDEEA